MSNSEPSAIVLQRIPSICRVYKFRSGWRKRFAQGVRCLRYAVRQLPRAGPDAGLGKLFEWIKHLESRTPEIPIISCGDRQPMPAGGRRDVAVFDRHTPAGLFEQPLLFRPHMCD